MSNDDFIGHNNCSYVLYNICNKPLVISLAIYHVHTSYGKVSGNIIPHIIICQCDRKWCFVKNFVDHVYGQHEYEVNADHPSRDIHRCIIRQINRKHIILYTMLFRKALYFINMMIFAEILVPPLHNICIYMYESINVYIYMYINALMHKYALCYM